MKEVLLNDEEYKDALQQLNALMRDAEQIENTDHKVLLYNVLQYFDYIHREPLSRLINAIKAYPELVNKLAEDETVQKLLSLYDLDINDNFKQDNSVGFVPADEVVMFNPPKSRDWLEMGNYEELEHQKLYAKNYQKVNFVLSRVGSDVFAVQNQCDGSILPLDQGVMEDHFLICPWHGCKYDLKTGQAINKTGKKLETFTTEIEDSGLLKVEIAY